MAVFYNQATLTYNNTTTSSNIVSGELLEVLSVQKNAVADGYRPGDTVTYVVSLTNAGTSAISGLTVTDDLGAYSVGGQTYTPLTYLDGSLLYYVDGILQATPPVTAGPPLSVSGISVPAGGDAILIYRATANDFADPAEGGSITNTVTVTGGGLSTPLEASDTLDTLVGPLLTVNKAISPSSVTENDTVTYTFVIQNTGNAATVATDDVTLTDTFSPILSNLTVTYNGVVWVEPTNYTYDATTGVFATVPGQIEVPAATYTRDPVTGIWTVAPGTATLTVRGTI